LLVVGGIGFEAAMKDQALLRWLASQFARQFSACLETSPAAYVRRLRVEQARRRIEEGASCLKQVARDCGFAT
jgi:transcriptional regulator GlxA family with amidase domain